MSCYESTMSSRFDEALERLARIDPRQSRIVEPRFFAGLNVEEAGEVMGISPKTIKREWRSAKAGLHREMETVTPNDSGTLAAGQGHLRSSCGARTRTAHRLRPRMLREQRRDTEGSPGSLMR
jgi:hypothetical protein